MMYFTSIVLVHWFTHRVANSIFHCCQFRMARNGEHFEMFAVNIVQFLYIYIYFFFHF